MKLMKLLVITSLFVCLDLQDIVAQRSIRFTETNFRLKEAIKYIDIQYYQQAYILLSDYLTHFKQDNRSMQTLDNQTTSYYFYLCALKLNKWNAEKDFVNFLKETPIQHLQQIGNFELGKYYYEHAQFEKAITHYESSSIDILSNKELTQRNFELGYAYLVTQQLDKVEPYFQSAKNIQGDYFKPGNYYHGLLSYYKKDYQEAKASFLAVKDDERYKHIIPFYLTEIDYVSGEKEKALDEALQYLASTNKLDYTNELNQMVAQIYFEQEDFAKAELYYKTYIQHAPAIRDEDYFKLAYCQYQQGKITDAIPNFEKIMNNNSASNSSYAYLLAMCYLKNDDKERVAEVLNKNKNLFNDPEQKELITYTIAKLSYDRLDDQNAFSQLNAFVQQYPNSAYAEEANELLAYLNIKNENFSDALIAMNKLKNISYKLKKVYQKANYARGIQMLKDDNPDRAIFNFIETKKFPVDESTISLADFWLAECNYRLGRYNEAMTNCSLYLNNADTIALADYTRKVHIIKAYIHFNNNENEQFAAEYAFATGDTNSSDLLSSVGTIKPNYVPEKVPVIANDPYVLMYNLPEEKIDFVYKPIPLKPLALNNEIKRHDQTNFYKLLVGNLSSIECKAAYNADDLVNFPLYIDFNRSASKGKIRFQDVNQTHLGLYSNTEVNKHLVDLSFAIDREKYNYYGYDHSFYNYNNTDLKQVFLNIGAKASFQPLKENKSGINYKVDAYTGIYADSRGAGEYAFRMDAPIHKQLKKDLLVQSDFLLDANVYFVKSKNTQSNSLLAWRPSITKELAKLKIKAGLYPTLGNHFYLLPDLSLQYPVKNKSTYVELALQSSIRLNTFKQLSELNPFIFSYVPTIQTKNTEIFAGLNGNLSSNCSYSLRSGIALINDLPLFLNDTAFDNKQFKIIYEKQATAFLFDASIDYTIHSELLAGAALHLRPLIGSITSQEAWHYIPSTLAVYGKIRATKDIVVRADLFLLAGSKAIERNLLISNPYTKSLSSGLDFNVSANYTINKTWNALIEINNLFGSKYQRWYGYPNYGTNVMIGIIHSFKSF